LQFRGISFGGQLAAFNITNNTVGGTIPNNIINAGNNFTTAIFGSCGLTSVVHTVTGNTVQNIYANYTGASAVIGSLIGIQVQGGNSALGTFNVSNNVVKNLTSGTEHRILGITNFAQSSGQIVSQNTIFNLVNQSNGALSGVAGLYAQTSTSGTNTFAKNIIRNCYNTGTNNNSLMYGIWVASGTVNYENNMISLGYDNVNNPVTNNYNIRGIRESGGTNNYFYNSVHVGGNGVAAGISNTYAFFSSGTGSRNLRNNIFFNSRSNAAGTAVNYGYALPNTGTTIADNNDIAASGVGAVMLNYNGTDYTNIDVFFSATGLEDNSVSAPVKFVNNATDLRLVGSPDVTNFYVNNEGEPSVPVTTDIDGKVRSTLSPDLGFFEFIGTGSWIGLTNSRWELAGNTIVGGVVTAGNWEDGIVPTSLLNAKVWRAPNMPVINATSGTQFVFDLHQKPASIVTITNSKLQIKGTIFPKRSFTSFINAQNGTVEMIGTSGAQTLAPKWFVNKTISTLTNSNTTGLVIATPTASDTMLISDALNFGSVNSSTITTNDNLTLLSSATRTANFGDITNAGANTGNTITGKVNIERYLFAQKSWRLLATPIMLVTSPTITTAWRESNSALTSTGYGTQITGPSGFPTFDQLTQRASMKSYVPATNSFADVTNPNVPIANNAGYFVFVRGDRGVAVGGTTGATNLRIKGDIRTGNQVFSVPANKYQTFGNPYPSRIDYRKVTKNNIGTDFIVWNPRIAGLYNVGGYETYAYDGTNYRRVGDGAIRNYIESGEAIFVQSNSATAGSVVVKEADKGTGSSLQSRVGVTRPTLEVNLFAKDVDGSIYLADGVMLNFDNAYSPAVDNYDVRKIMNIADNLAVKNGTYNLVVERRPNLTATDTIKLNLTGVRVAPYRFDIDPSVLGNTGLEAILKDNFLQTETTVSFTDVTSVPFNITSTPASYAADRFMIVFKQAPTTNFTTISATRNTDKTVTVNWGIATERNVTNYTVEQSNDGINFTAIAQQTATANNGTNPTYSKQDAAASMANNWYRVKANNTNGTSKYTAIAMVGAVNETIQIAASKMSIYPNPVIGGNVNLHLDNQAKGNYAVQITNAAGQIVSTENVQVENNSALRIIKLGTAATGNYQATIVDESGKKTTIGFFVK
jgi:Secretion system C-terminal sorting domain